MNPHSSYVETTDSKIGENKNFELRTNFRLLENYKLFYSTGEKIDKKKPQLSYKAYVVVLSSLHSIRD